MALASLMVNAMEPSPVDQADWPAFMDELLHAAGDERAPAVAAP